MKSLIEYLVEVFSDAYPFSFVDGPSDIERSASPFWAYKFVSTGGKQKTDVSVLLMYNKQERELTIGFTRMRSVDILGQGDAFKIFATVISIVERFLQTKGKSLDMKTITFAAKKHESSRVSLYKKIIERMGRKYGYKSSVEVLPNAVVYSLRK